MTAWRKFLKWWKSFALLLGKVQTILLLSIVYHLTVGPIGVISWLARRDLLGLRPSGRVSCWIALPDDAATIERARKQF